MDTEELALTAGRAVAVYGLWAEIPVGQFVIGVSALLLTHLSATAANVSAGARIWRQGSKVLR